MPTTLNCVFGIFSFKVPVVIPLLSFSRNLVVVFKTLRDDA
jgi:hypothetical protein